MFNFISLDVAKLGFSECIWRPPRLSELTPMIFDTGLTHLGLEDPYMVIIKARAYIV